MKAVDPLVVYALRLGDDGLVLAHRLAEWAGKAPEIEEDIALTNMALDLLGQARVLLTHAGTVEGRGRTEDDLAYLRDERDFLNCQLVEHPNGDFALTIARQLLFSTFQLAEYQALSNSADDTLAAVAAKGVKEVAYHRDHATQWTLRLGDGTDESHQRLQEAFERLWPYVGELFEETDAELADKGIAADVAALRPGWDSYLGAVLSEATLRVPDVPPARTGGRHGIHTEAMGYLLAEMQYLHRSHRGAQW